MQSPQSAIQAGFIAIIAQRTPSTWRIWGHLTMMMEKRKKCRLRDLWDPNSLSDKKQAIKIRPKVCFNSWMKAADRTYKTYRTKNRAFCNSNYRSRRLICDKRIIKNWELAIIIFPSNLRKSKCLTKTIIAMKVAWRARSGMLHSKTKIKQCCASGLLIPIRDAVALKKSNNKIFSEIRKIMAGIIWG